LINLITLGIDTNANSRGAAAEKEVFSSAESTATSIIFTQRESLAYTTKYSLWLAGSVTKRDVLIARALLSQRLNVIDIENQTMGSRLPSSYLSTLKISDEIIAKAPEGLLSLASANVIRGPVNSFISDMLAASRVLVVSYQQELDKILIQVASERKSAAQRNLMLLLVLILLTSIFLVWISRTILAQYERTKEIIDQEVKDLELTMADLKSSQLAVKTLEELNESKNDFISTVNHELRTPLTSIIGYVDLLKDIAEEDKTGKSSTIVPVIEKNALVLLDLVESILSLSKLDSREPEVTHVEVDLVKVVEKSIFVLSPQAELAGIKILIDTDKNVEYTANGNPSQLSQVFINLLSNAIKFSPNGSSVHVKLRRILNDNMFLEIEVSITDQGMGIPEAEIPQLFHRFFRASNAANSQIAGTGLGLAIVSRIVELHNGRIGVTSTQNIGSTFTVKLPAFISSVDRLILEKRGSVLKRAIDAIQGALNEDLQHVCHEMGGAIGFYALEEHSEQVALFAKWLRNSPGANDVAILAKKDALLEVLNTTLRIIEDQEKN